MSAECPSLHERFNVKVGRYEILDTVGAGAFSKVVRAHDPYIGRIVAIIGPVAIITISIVVGGLIVSVMTALLSINQVVG